MQARIKAHYVSSMELLCTIVGHKEHNYDFITLNHVLGFLIKLTVF